MLKTVPSVLSCFLNKKIALKGNFLIMESAGKLMKTVVYCPLKGAL